MRAGSERLPRILDGRPPLLDGGAPLLGGGPPLLRLALGLPSGWLRISSGWFVNEKTGWRLCTQSLPPGSRRTGVQRTIVP